MLSPFRRPTQVILALSSFEEEREK